MKEPELVATDEKVKHSSRKMQNATTVREQVSKDEERQRVKLETLQRDLALAQRAADEAAGMGVIYDLRERNAHTC